MLLHLKRSNSSSSSLHFKPRDRKLHLLVAATGPRDTSWANALVVRLSKNSSFEMRAIVDDVIPRLSQTVVVIPNRPMSCLPTTECGATASEAARDVDFYRQQAFELVEWADLMVLAPIDADTIAKMLAGIADTFLLEVLRGWDVSNKILFIPGMSTHMWKNPVTKRHMSKIHRKCHWIRPMPPILWTYNDDPKSPKRNVDWSGFNDVLSIIKNQADLMGLGRDVDVVSQNLGLFFSGTPKVNSKLPPEIWTIILEFTQDWELAQALGIYTSLAMPQPWSRTPKNPNDPLKVYEHELEWVVLTCDTPSICKKLLQSPSNFHDLPYLVVKLIIRFSLIEVLSWMEANRPDLYKAFEGKVLPTKASAYYGRPDVLDYWRGNSSSSSSNNDCNNDDLSHLYDAEAMDGASKNGFVHVLDWWWRRSGLPLVFTEAALEQASGKGHLLVLEWWRDAAAQDDRIVLRPGKSLLWAAQHGQVAVIRWWVASGIPVGHGDSVAKLASRWGRVEVLEAWRQLKGDDKMVFDADVLIQPTIHQHIDVLEWWRGFAHGELEGMDGRRHRVEYRPCVIEEALEDSIGDQERVRKWWARNGLNLGSRSVEWMRTKCL
ncbi:phosphopantothenoylcysteine decarboxylase [Sodiomyces alkalinus F11]|uniref:Phosphopantothenoylcysteine decarboxylase n=1 Tax=Sodiomyces alkalinus (strain CBS 110278 / VKM F-3762 / F11) TaxID=1314773 RepID=A0A3N2PPP3_SODAK|nr:phosphopantothenoylcysteine decarboxylase [Sodiomyces alkalinus F11]ROT36478.1 phosphopantothenoylcysteine decarboxylase [Sodiomyces alkalinus F11]